MLCTRFTDASANIGYIAYTVSAKVYLEVHETAKFKVHTILETIAEN